MNGEGEVERYRVTSIIEVDVPTDHDRRKYLSMEAEALDLARGAGTHHLGEHGLVSAEWRIQSAHFLSGDAS